MSIFSKQPSASAEDGAASGFLPEEYVESRRVRRSTVLHLTLFTVVLLGVAGAFVVTNQQWNDVREHGKAVDVRYQQAAENLEQLNTLEAQAGTLVNKAEVVLALVERVPRSLLIAELTSAMPEQMTITELELKSQKIAPPRRDDEDKKKKSSSTRKSRTADVDPEAGRVEVPRYRTSLIVMGIAPTHQDIARYTAALQRLDLLKGIELKVSEATIIKQRSMIKFRIEGMIDPDADPRATRAGDEALATVTETTEGVQ
jgi:hypothetical protein